MREPSIFEKIVAGEIPSTKIRENNEFLAILDVFPNCKGQTLIIPKKWYDSDISLMPDDVYNRYMLAVKEVVGLLKKGLGVEKVGRIIEGEGVNHTHVKLYPMHGINSDIMLAKERVWFDKYPGYLISKMGDFKTIKELDQVAQQIANHG